MMTRDDTGEIIAWGQNGHGYTFVIVCDRISPITYFEPRWHRCFAVRPSNPFPKS